MPDQAAVGEDEVRPAAELLQAAEDVVPAPAVQPCGMFAQFVQHLVHLEGGQYGLDQHRRLDRAAQDAEALLGMDEHLVPQPRFEMALHLGQVEIRRAAARQQRLRIVEEVQTEIEQAGGHRLAVHGEVLFQHVPAARAHEQHRYLVVQAIGLAVRVDVADGAGDRIAQIDLGIDDVVPARRHRVFQVRHVHAGAGIEAVDQHLALRRPGDLDAPVLQFGGHRGDGPVAVAHAGGLGQEIGQFACVQPGLALYPALQQGPAQRLELARQFGDKGQRTGSQDGGLLRRDRRSDGYACGIIHDRFLVEIRIRKDHIIQLCSAVCLRQTLRCCLSAGRPASASPPCPTRRCAESG